MVRKKYFVCVCLCGSGMTPYKYFPSVGSSLPVTLWLEFILAQDVTVISQSLLLGGTGSYLDSSLKRNLQYALESAEQNNLRTNLLQAHLFFSNLSWQSDRSVSLTHLSYTSACMPFITL